MTKSRILLLFLCSFLTGRVARADDIVSFDFSKDSFFSHTFVFGPFDVPSTYSEVLLPDDPGLPFAVFFGGASLAITNDGADLWQYCEPAYESCPWNSGELSADWGLTFPVDPIQVTYGNVATGTWIPGTYQAESGTVLSIVDPPTATPEEATKFLLLWGGLILGFVVVFRKHLKGRIIR
jgi:hypothetical protein